MYFWERMMLGLRNLFGGKPQPLPKIKVVAARTSKQLSQ